MGGQRFVDETRRWIRKNSGGEGVIRLNICESSYKWDRDETRHGFRYKSDRDLDGGLGSGWLDAEFDPARHGMFLEPRS